MTKKYLQVAALSQFLFTLSLPLLVLTSFRYLLPKLNKGEDMNNTLCYHIKVHTLFRKETCLPTELFWVSIQSFRLLFCYVFSWTPRSPSNKTSNQFVDSISLLYQLIARLNTLENSNSFKIDMFVLHQYQTGVSGRTTHSVAQAGFLTEGKW